MSAKAKSAGSRKTVTENPKIRKGFNYYPLLAFGALVILGYIFWKLMNDLSHLQDDAYITFRYIRNLIDGNGLDFNPGEKVEGYTNFLWLIILAGASLLDIKYTEFAGQLSSIFGLAVLIYVFLISSNINKKDQSAKPLYLFTALLPVLLLVFTPAYVYWSVSGMETSMFIFLILASLFYYIRSKEDKNFIAPSLLALAALTRPEGILFFVIIYMHKMFFLIKGKKKILTGNNIFEILLFALPVIAHMIFRLSYYGYIFPNTFYAKTSYSAMSIKDGMEYFFTFCREYLLYGTVLVVPLFLFNRKELRFELSLLYSIIIFYTIYVIIQGGDVLPLNRFWLPLLPLIYVLLAKAIVYLIESISLKRGYPFAGISAVIILMSFFAYYNFVSNNQKAVDLSKKEISFIETLKRNAFIVNGLQEIAGRKLTVAATTIGAFSFYTDANVIDMLGLTDEYIAHNPSYITELSNDPEVKWREKKYNADYVLQRRPDYIFFSTGTKPSAYCERALFLKRDFFKYYLLKFVPLDGNDFQFIYSLKNKNMQNSGPEDMSVPFRYQYVKDFITLSDLIKLYKETKKPEILTKIKDIVPVITSNAPAGFVEHYNTAGGIFVFARQNETAKKYFETAISVDSLSAPANIGLSTLYYLNNENSKGDDCMRRLEKNGIMETGLFNKKD